MIFSKLITLWHAVGYKGGVRVSGARAFGACIDTFYKTSGDSSPAVAARPSAQNDGI